MLPSRRGEAHWFDGHGGYDLSLEVEWIREHGARDGLGRRGGRILAGHEWSLRGVRR